MVHHAVQESLVYLEAERTPSLLLAAVLIFVSHPTAQLHHVGAYQLIPQVLAHVVAQVQRRLPYHSPGPARPRKDRRELFPVLP